MRNENEDQIEPEDIDENGITFFEHIDRENTRHLRAMEQLQRLMEDENCLHRQNCQSIRATFGLLPPPPVIRPLTAKLRNGIKEQVRMWSLAIAVKNSIKSVSTLGDCEWSRSEKKETVRPGLAPNP